MTSDPSVPRPTVPSSSIPPRPQVQLVTVSNPTLLVLAVLVVGLGIGLGLANQSSPEAEMALRVPALLASLVMVAQGIVTARKNFPRQEHIEVVPDGETSQRGRELAVVRPITARPGQSSVAVRVTPANLTIPVLAILLAAWLGLADLRASTDVSGTLSTLSLIAAFVLAAIGWLLLPQNKK